MSLLITIIIMVTLLMLGVPIAFSLGLVSSLWVLVEGYGFMPIASRFFAGINKFVYLAIPFFLVSGSVMNHSGVTDRLIAFCNLLVGKIRGGLAIVNILASLFFAGMSGAALPDVYALGKIFIPSMEKEGYSRAYSCAVTAASSTMGPTIPPSISIVVYAGLTGVSVGGLYAAAIIPGILIAVGQIAVVLLQAKLENLPIAAYQRPSYTEIFKTTKQAILPLLTPIIIIGGILFGVVTPTEAAVLAALYAFMLGFFVYKNLTIKDIKNIFIDSTYQYASLLFIIGSASILGWNISRTCSHVAIIDALLKVSPNTNVILFLVILFLLFVGTWLETGATVVLLAPLLHPVMTGLGFHPFVFTTIMLRVVHIGLLTPPVGICVFAASSVGKCPAEDIFKAIWPFVVIDVITVLFTVMFPEVILFLPRMLGFT